MSVVELTRSKWCAVLGQEPWPKLLSIIESVEILLAYNESTNPVIPTLLNDTLLIKELKAVDHRKKHYFITNIQDNWLNLELVKKAAATQLILGLFPEIDTLKNTNVLINLKVLYEIDERRDEF